MTVFSHIITAVNEAANDIAMKGTKLISNHIHNYYKNSKKIFLKN